MPQFLSFRLPASLCFLVLIFSDPSFAQNIPEWQDPQVISINTEPTRADFIPYPDEKSALLNDGK